MLKIPSFRTISTDTTTTVYQDDEKWYLFYLIPGLPTVRQDKNGKPVFLLAAYHIPEQARTEDKSLPRGGGFMNFDVQFAVDKDTIEDARGELQEWVDEEYARRRNDSNYSSLAEYSTTQAPTVEFAEPLLSGGTVSMHTVQSELLTSNRLAEAPASLVSGSTAVFNVDLTEIGASFMKELMLDSNNTGRVDLTPIQVIYDLKMWARLPPVKITVTGESERIHKTLLKISETNRDNPCTPAEVETYRNNGVSSSNLKETGSVKVVVDKGDALVPDDVVNSLQEYALNLFDTMIKERFLVPAESDDEDIDFDDDAPAIGDADPGWAARLFSGANYSGQSSEIREDTSSLSSMNNRVTSVQVRRGYRVTLFKSSSFRGQGKQLTRSISHLDRRWKGRTSSIKIWRPPTSRYKVRRSVNHSEMHLEIMLDRSQVVEWPLVGEATLQTFFTDMNKQEISKHVVELFADSFRTLGVTVRAIVDFENSAIQAVEVQTEYKATDSTGVTRTENGGFTFSKDHVEPGLFNPPVVSGKREYLFRHRIIYDNGESTEFTDWEPSSSNALNISVADPGKIDIDVSAASLKWDIVTAVSVKLTYQNAEQGIDPKTRSLELTSLNPTQKWTAQFTRELRGKIDAKITYHLSDDKVIEGGSKQIDVTDNLFMIPPPQVDILNIGLVPSGDWSEVAQVVVSLKYDAGDGRVFDKSLRFHAIDEFVEWTVLLRDASRRKFEYQKLVVYKNGQQDLSEWITREGDQAVPIHVEGVPRLVVNVMPALVDFVRTPAVTVTMSYGNERQTLSFVDNVSKTFSIPLNAQGDTDFTYEITWHPVDGDPVKSAPERTNSSELFIPRAEIATPGKLQVIVRGFAVDFTVTPFVDVLLTWDDGDRQERKLLMLSEDIPNASWEVDIGDRSQRRYHYAITYNLADGTRVEGLTGDTDDPVISITPLQN